MWLYYNFRIPFTIRVVHVRPANVHEHKELLRSRRIAERSIIIVAPPDVSHRIERTVGDFDVIAFRSLDELDRWRRGEIARPETIRADLVTALGEIGVDPARLSSKLRHTLEAFAHHRTVPAAHQLAARWPSRRSFYRVWRDEIDEPPGSFLRRVRMLFASRLIGDGATTKEAALRAGFGSTDGLRRLLAQRQKVGRENE